MLCKTGSIALLRTKFVKGMPQMLSGYKSEKVVWQNYNWAKVSQHPFWQSQTYLGKAFTSVHVLGHMHATWVMLQNWQTCCSRSCYQNCLPSWWTSVYSSGNSSCKREYMWSWANHTDASQVVVDAGGFPISLICDNCPTNQGAYDKFMGPCNGFFKCLGRYVYCVYDYIHIFKNIRNNWITVVD